MIVIKGGASEYFFQLKKKIDFFTQKIPFEGNKILNLYRVLRYLFLKNSANLNRISMRKERSKAFELCDQMVPKVACVILFG